MAAVVPLPSVRLPTTSVLTRVPCLISAEGHPSRAVAVVAARTTTLQTRYCFLYINLALLVDL
jgi:hypothetical protein